MTTPEKQYICLASASQARQNCDLDPNNLKPKLIQGIVILNITVMLYQNQLMNEVAIAMTKGEHVCHLMGHNSTIMTRSKFCFLHAHAQCMSELCSKFQICASNTVGGVAETQTVLQCDMVKICMSYKGT